MAGWAQDPSSEWSTLPPTSLVRPALLSSCVKWSRKWWCPLHRSLRRSNKRMLTRCCLLSLFGVLYFTKTPWTRFFGLLGSSLICLSIKKCLKLSNFFLTQFSAIGSTALQITLNYPSCFPRLWEIQIFFFFFANDIQSSPLSWFFSSCLIISIDLCFIPDWPNLSDTEDIPE